jgi:hypothetical protein
MADTAYRAAVLVINPSLDVTGADVPASSAMA